MALEKVAGRAPALAALRASDREGRA
jgi:hypothetical protein